MDHLLQAPAVRAVAADVDRAEALDYGETPNRLMRRTNDGMDAQ
jgi:hypothetical protein